LKADIQEGLAPLAGPGISAKEISYYQEKHPSLLDARNSFKASRDTFVTYLRKTSQSVFGRSFCRKVTDGIEYWFSFSP
jgi:hypothetical protein